MDDADSSKKRGELTGLLHGCLAALVMICGVVSGMVKSYGRLYVAIFYFDTVPFLVSVSCGLFVVGILSCGYGMYTGFLKRPRESPTWFQVIANIVRSFIAPALLEEVLWRGLFLPNPQLPEDKGMMEWEVLLPYAGAGVVLFVVYHSVGGYLLRRAGRTGAAEAFQTPGLWCCAQFWEWYAQQRTMAAGAASGHLSSCIGSRCACG